MPKASTLATSSPDTVTALRDVLGVNAIDLAQSAGMVAYATLADLPASPADGTAAWVTSDGTAENNGFYRYDSGTTTWVKWGSWVDDAATSAQSASDSAAAAAAATVFTQSGTGAVARTIQDKARERVSVLDFMSDAERADVLLASPLLDHTASVQKAANAIVAKGGGVLEFPAEATLRIDQMQLLGTTGAWLSGVKLEGNGTKIIANDVDLSPGSGIIWAGYIDGLEICGLEIDGHYEGKVAIDTGRNHALRVGPAKSVNIHHNYLHNLGSGNTTDIGGDALYTGMVEGLNFHHNRVRGWGRWVIACVDWMSGVNVSDNVCQFYTADPQRPYVLGFIDLESNLPGNPIVNVSITGNIVDYATAIACSASGDATLDFRKNVVISDNQLIGSLTDDRATYRGDAYNYGIIVSKVDGLVISGNNIELGNDTSPIIQLSNGGGSLYCSNVVISGNRLRHKVAGNLDIYANNCLVTGNTIRNDNTGGGLTTVRFNTGCTNCHFIGNVVNHPGTSFPLEFGSTGSSTVAGNRFVSPLMRASVVMNTGTHVFGNSGTTIQYTSVVGATDARIGPSIADINTNLVTSPVEGQKAVLPYFVKQILQHSAAPTTGTWARGDLVINSNPNETSPAAWMCSVAGTPGTWVPFGGMNMTWGTAAPVSGTYTRGAIVWNSTPSSGGRLGWVCTAAGTPGTWLAFGDAGVLSATKVYDWPNLPTATAQSTTVTVTGAAIGDFAVVTDDAALNGTMLWAEVTAADTVTVWQRNDTGADVNVGNGTLRVRVRKA